jgi:4-amino-4-deoxy-L-arabinose transferase-like glycosyltransferase
MERARLRIVLAVLGIAALMYLLFFHHLAGRDLWGSHEARAAQDASSILYRNDWGLPRLTDEQIDLQKPPMYYWLVAAIAKIRGEVDAWAVRLPAALAATLCVALVVVVLWRRGRPVSAVTAAVLLITAQHYTWLARTARIDMPLTLCIALAVLTIGLNRRWMIAGFAAMGIGMLLKGPIGFVLPMAVIIADCLLEWRSAGRKAAGCRSVAPDSECNDATLPRPPHHPGPSARRIAI